MRQPAMTIPSPNELRRRIHACHTELVELKRLLRMATAVGRANSARDARHRDDRRKGGRAE